MGVPTATKPADRANARVDGVPTIFPYPRWWARREVVPNMVGQGAHKGRPYVMSIP